MADNNHIVKEDDLVKNYTEELKLFKHNKLIELRKLITNKKFEEVISAGHEAEKQLPEYAQGSGDGEISEILFIIGSAMRETGAPADEIKSYALKACQFLRTSQQALWLLRDCNNNISDKSQYMHVQGRGSFRFIQDGEEREEPFVSIYGMICDSQDEALGYIREFERHEVRDTIIISHCEVIGPKPNIPKGIYKTSALIAGGSLDDLGKTGAE